MSDVNSLYTQNGVPVANKVFEKVIFKYGLNITPTDLIAFQDIMITDFENFLFATRGKINGVYKTEYNTETEEFDTGLVTTLQQAQVLQPTSNYELKVSKGKAYIGGKFIEVPLDDYVEVPDNDVYPDLVVLHLILERLNSNFGPTALGQPGFAVIDGKHTSDREEAGYRLRLVDTVPTEVDSEGNILFLELAKLVRPVILKTQSEIVLDQMDGPNDDGVNWAKYEANLNILTVEKVTYLTYIGETVVKIPSTITQAQWDALNSSGMSSDLVPGVYYVPYTRNVLIVLSDISLISQERIWYLPHTADLELTDMRYIIEDLPAVISAAIQAVENLAVHTTKFFEAYVPAGLQDELTNGTSDTFWVLPIADDEPIVVYLDEVEVNSSLYTVTNVVDRTYTKQGEEVTEEWGRIVFTIPPASGQRLTVDFYHDAHTLYVENAKHEAHKTDIDAHTNYINDNEFEEHTKNLNGTNPPIGTVVAHDNRYYTQAELDHHTTGKSDKGHDHDTEYSAITHGHQISEVVTLQGLLTKIEDNLGVYDKTTRLIIEQITRDIDGAKTIFDVESLMLDDETTRLVGVRADLTDDSINNPIILDLLYNPSFGTVTSLPDNFTIEDTAVTFPTDGTLVGGHINPNTDNVTPQTFEIISNTATTITVDEDISTYTVAAKPYSVNDFTPGGVNPWTVPKKVSYGGNNLGLVVSAVQADDEVWTLWVDTEDAGVTHTLWWSTQKVSEEVWSPPVNTTFSVDSDSRPSIAKIPDGFGDEDLMFLFTSSLPGNSHNVYYSYVSHGQTSFSDPELFYDLSQGIYAPQGKYIHNTGGTGDRIWLVYTRDEGGVSNVYLRIFENSAPYSLLGSEILISDGVDNCYYPTLSQELSDGGNVWIAWVCDNSIYDNKKKPMATILDVDAATVVTSDFIPSDISTVLDNFNIDSRIDMHHSVDENVWLVYSVIEGGSFNIYYVHLDHYVPTNNIINLTPPVELNRGHEVSITERSDQTIWINYNQTTQVYNQVRLLGAGEVKWTRATQKLEFEVAPINGSFIEIRWRLPFSDIEGRLEAAESEIRTHHQQITQLAALIGLGDEIDWGELVDLLQQILATSSQYFEGDCTFVDVDHWLMPVEYNEVISSSVRLFKNGSRLRENTDWTISGNVITFTQPTPDTAIVIAEWNQVTIVASDSSASSDSSVISNSSESSDSSVISNSSESSDSSVISNLSESSDSSVISNSSESSDSSTV
jgi:hypothetical protein